MARKKVIATFEGGVTEDYTDAENAWADAVTAEYEKEKPKLDAQKKIYALEDKITPRRIRDAFASDEGKKWVADVEAEIAKERAKL